MSALAWKTGTAGFMQSFPLALHMLPVPPAISCSHHLGCILLKYQLQEELSADSQTYSGPKSLEVNPLSCCRSGAHFLHSSFSMLNFFPIENMVNIKWSNGPDSETIYFHCDVITSQRIHQDVFYRPILLWSWIQTAQTQL